MARDKVWKLGLLVVLLIVGAVAALSYANSARQISTLQTEQAQIFSDRNATLTARP